MQLKFTRSSAKKGMLGNKLMYRLDAMLQLTPAEHALFTKHRQMDMSISTLVPQDYDNEVVSKFASGLRIDRLIDGVSIESEYIDHPLQAERMLIQACTKAEDFAITAETFSGGSRIVEIVRGETALLATD